MWDPPRLGRYEAHFRAYPVSFKGKDHLEQGGKILLPPSALEQLARLQIQYPMLFQLTNETAGRTTHSGVQEFVAEEGVCYLPYWMMQNLCLEEGSLVHLKSAALPPATFTRFQPQSTAFLDISDPRAVLETALRGFACLTRGDVIRVIYNSQPYHLSVLETKPKEAVSIIETDMEVDFAPPVGYKEPVREQAGSSDAMVFGAATKAQESDDSSDDDAPAFQAFSGVGNRVDGKGAPTVAEKRQATVAAVAKRTDYNWGEGRSLRG